MRVPTREGEDEDAEELRFHVEDHVEDFLRLFSRPEDPMDRTRLLLAMREAVDGLLAREPGDALPN